MRNLLVVLVLVASWSCVPEHAPFHPVTVSAPSDAYGRALRGVVAAGMTVDTKDDAAGVITTKWEEAHAFMQVWQRLRWSISIANGQMLVSSQCQLQDRTESMGSKNVSDWRDCTEQPAGRDAAAKKLADTILAQPGGAAPQPAPVPDPVAPANPEPGPGSAAP